MTLTSPQLPYMRLHVRLVPLKDNVHINSPSITNKLWLFGTLITPNSFLWNGNSGRTGEIQLELCLNLGCLHSECWNVMKSARPSRLTCRIWRLSTWNYQVLVESKTTIQCLSCRRSGCMCFLGESFLPWGELELIYLVLSLQYHFHFFFIPTVS